MLEVDEWCLEVGKGDDPVSLTFFQKGAHAVKHTMSSNVIYSEMFQSTFEAWGDKMEQNVDN